MIPPAIDILGLRLVGINEETGLKFVFSVVFVLLVLLIGRLLRAAASLTLQGLRETVRFWERQGIQLLLALVTLVGLASIWFDDPTRLATALGLITAGLAFALQKVVTAIAGYFIILRGRTFTVGDRIMMGGVRGDVIALRFTATTIMEMGQPPSVEKDEPAMWVQARQYTGRIVTVTNAKIFEEPVYNYTRDFDYIWEELTLPVPYSTDRARVEEILMQAARRHMVSIGEMGEQALLEMERRYFLRPSDIGPRVYWRLTGQWLELSLRFLVREWGIREVKDSISREILVELEREGFRFPAETFEITGAPPLEVRLAGSTRRGPLRDHEGDAQHRA